MIASLASLVAALLVACSTQAAPQALPGTILANSSPALAGAFPLDGQRVAGALHVFVAEPAVGFDRVEFSLDGRRRPHVDTEAPYTPTPDDGPLDLDALGPGKHALVAVSYLPDGSSTESRAEFTVAEHTPPTEPGNPGDPQEPSDPADPTDPTPEPEDPADPGQPTDPEQPSDPQEPTEPEEPTQPEDPTQPEEPTDPGRPTPEPEEPGDPTPPVAPGGVWQPKPGTSWQWQLSGKLDTSVQADVYDIDLEGTSKATIDQLHSQGRRVICYFSAGSFEPGRSDASKFPASVKGEKMDGWNELWLDIRNIDALAPVMLARLDLAKQKGCDAVEPDNIDGYQNDTGFPLKAADQLAYNRWLAEQAHQRGLAIALKNDLDQVKDLVDHFDFAINEECFSFGECDLLKPFIAAGKAVFGAEYELAPAQFCSKAISLNMDFIRKNLDLDAYRQSCR